MYIHFLFHSYAGYVIKYALNILFHSIAVYDLDGEVEEILGSCLALLSSSFVEHSTRTTVRHVPGTPSGNGGQETETRVRIQHSQADLCPSFFKLTASVCLPKEWDPCKCN